MEDALARPLWVFQHYKALSLNPCCNGRCTRTLTIMNTIDFLNVLILVVMEDALALDLAKAKLITLGLNPCCNGRCTRTSFLYVVSVPLNES